MRLALLLAAAFATACASTPPPCTQIVATEGRIGDCVIPNVAGCLGGDAGTLATCEAAADVACGAVSGTAAARWAAVEHAEIVQGFLPKGR